MFKKTENIFYTFNQLFSAFDKEFRAIERRFGIRNAPPFTTDTDTNEYLKYEHVETYDDGVKRETYKNGRLHGEVVYHDGKTPTEYFLEGRQVTKDKWDEYVQKLEDDKQHYITIDDSEYAVSGKQLRELKSKLNDVLKLEKK